MERAAERQTDIQTDREREEIGESRDERRETRDERRETRDERRETRDERRETKDERGDKKERGEKEETEDRKEAKPEHELFRPATDVSVLGASFVSELSTHDVGSHLVDGDSDPAVVYPRLYSSFSRRTATAQAHKLYNMMTRL